MQTLPLTTALAYRIMGGEPVRLTLDEFAERHGFDVRELFTGNDLTAPPCVVAWSCGVWAADYETDGPGRFWTMIERDEFSGATLDVPLLACAEWLRDEFPEDYPFAFESEEECEA